MRVHWLLIVVVIAILAWVAVRRLLAWLRFSWRLTFVLLLVAAIAGAAVFVQQQSSTLNELPDPTYQSRRQDVEHRR